MKLRTKRLLAVGIELTGIAVVNVGIGCEIVTGAHTYLIVVTVGSMLIAAGGLLWAKVKL